MPRQACARYPCEAAPEAETKCWTRVRLEEETRPEESCQLRPRRVCHQQQVSLNTADLLLSNNDYLNI